MTPTRYKRSNHDIQMTRVLALLSLAACIGARAQTATYTCQHVTNNFSTVYYSDSFLSGAENNDKINSAFRDYMSGKYGVAQPSPGCSFTVGSDVAKARAATEDGVTTWRNQRSRVVMTGWVMAAPVEETHAAEGTGPSQAEAVQDARQNALRGSRTDIKKWIAPTCTQGTAKAGLYNEKTVVGWTCSVSFMTSTDKALPSAHSAYGEGSTKAQAIAAAKGSANRDHSGVDNFDLPVCSQGTKKGGLYNEKMIVNWYCSVGYTATQ